MGVWEVYEIRAMYKPYIGTMSIKLTILSCLPWFPICDALTERSIRRSHKKS